MSLPIPLRRISVGDHKEWHNFCGFVHLFCFHSQRSDIVLFFLMYFVSISSLCNSFFSDKAVKWSWNLIPLSKWSREVLNTNYCAVVQDTGCAQNLEGSVSILNCYASFSSQKEAEKLLVFALQRKVFAHSSSCWWNYKAPASRTESTGVGPYVNPIAWLGNESGFSCLGGKCLWMPEPLELWGHIFSTGVPFLFSVFSLLVIGSEFLVSWWRAEKERQGLRYKAEG